MLKPLTTLAVASFLLLQPALPGYSQGVDKPLTFLLQQTGISRQLPLLKALVKETALLHTERCASQHFADIDNDAHWTAYNPAALAEQIRERLRQKMDPAHLAPALDWYTSDTASRISELEALPVLATELATFKTSLAGDPHWQARHKLIAQIIENTRADEFGAILGMEIEYAGMLRSGCIQKAAMQLSNQDGTQTDTPAATLNHEQLITDLARTNKTLLMQVFHGDNILGMAFQLRSLGNDQLLDYANFTATDNSRAFFKDLIGAVEKSLQSASDDVAG